MRVVENIPGEYRKNGRISVTTGKMVESERVPGKVRIRASIEKLSGQVPKDVRISVSTKKWSNLGEYREKVESV